MATPPLSVAFSSNKGTVSKVVYVLLSYVLALTMLPYAVSKIIAIQFQVFASRYAETLDASAGFFAIAAFFGRFQWFEVLLGFVEFIPSVLLMFRRTRATGAVLLLGPILFVAAIDYAYLPWGYEHVRLVITAMLVVDLVLLMLDRRTRSWVFGLVALGDDSSRKYWSLELVVGLLLVSGVIVPFLWAVRHFELDYGDLIGRPQINGRGTWDIKSFLVDHTAVDLQEGNQSAKAYFDFDGSCHITGLRNSPINCRFEPNGRLHTIKVTRFPLGPSLVSLEGKYEVAGSTLTITGTTGSHQISVLLSRSGW